jgi:Mg2+-importing ATPase
VGDLRARTNFDQVLGISGKVTGNWGQAALFSISVAVGIVPEMLPAIVNGNLARGAFALSKKKAIVKRLDSIQNVGGMTVLCSDKVGISTPYFLIGANL